MPRIPNLPPNTEGPAPDDLAIIHNKSTGDTESIELKDLTGYPLLGWIAALETWTYLSWNATTRTGVFTVPSNATTKYTPGHRIRIVQATGGIKFGIIVGVTTTTLTVFFPLGTTLNNEAVNTPQFSPSKAPFGFPGDATLWSIIFFANTSANPTVGVGSLGNFRTPASDYNIVFGPGSWEVGMEANLLQTNSSAGSIYLQGGLSETVNTSTASDYELIKGSQFTGTGTSNFISISVSKLITNIATMTLYGVVTAIAGAGTVNVGMANGPGRTRIYARSLYL